MGYSGRKSNFYTSGAACTSLVHQAQEFYSILRMEMPQNATKTCFSDNKRHLADFLPVNEREFCSFQQQANGTSADFVWLLLGENRFFTHALVTFSKYPTYSVKSFSRTRHSRCLTTWIFRSERKRPLPDALSISSKKQNKIRLIDPPETRRPDSRIR